MAYSIRFQLQEDIPCFEIFGRICNHADSIARYVLHRILEFGAERLLLDLRCATERPGPDKLFLHVLKYPPAWPIRCALIDLERNHEFVFLYLKLVRHRGHKIEFFTNPEEGRVWLLNGAGKANSMSDFEASRLKRNPIDRWIREIFR